MEALVSSAGPDRPSSASNSSSFEECAVSGNSLGATVHEHG